MPNETTPLANLPTSFTVLGGYRERNVGFVRYIYLIAADSVIEQVDADFLSVGLRSEVGSPTGLLLAPGTSYQLLIFPPKTGQFVETFSKLADGPQVEWSLEFSLPRVAHAIREWVFQQANRKWIALVHDYNGFWYQVGDKELPLSWQMQGAIMKENSSKVVLRGRSWHFAWGIENPLVYGTVQPPSSGVCGLVVPILANNCLQQIEQIKQQLANLQGITMVERQLPSPQDFSDTTYLEFTAAGATYRILGMSSSDAVLLERLRNGELSTKSYRFELPTPAGAPYRWDLSNKCIELLAGPLTQLSLDSSIYSSGLNGATLAGSIRAELPTEWAYFDDFLIIPSQKRIYFNPTSVTFVAGANIFSLLVVI